MTRIKDQHFIEADVSALIFLSLFVLPSFLHLGSRHGGRPPLTSDLRSDVSMTRKTAGSDLDLLLRDVTPSASSECQNNSGVTVRATSSQ